MWDRVYAQARLQIERKEKNMASKAKATENNWLVHDRGASRIETEVWLHAEGRVMQISVYDHAAPKHRRWTVTALDRESGAKATISHEFNTEARDLAFAQIEVLADSVARNLGVAS